MSTPSAVNDLLEQLQKELPAAFGRKFICGALPGLITPGGLANADSAGLGPRRVRSGKVCLYSRADFLDWLEKRLSPATSEVEEGVSHDV